MTGSKDGPGPDQSPRGSIEPRQPLRCNQITIVAGEVHGICKTGTSATKRSMAAAAHSDGTPAKAEQPKTSRNDE